MECLMEQQENIIKEFLINEGYTEKELLEYYIETGCDLMFIYDTIIQKYN